jgi:hypothetical protein
MFYQDCDCGELLRVAKGWDVWVCGSCGSSNETARFPVAAASESARIKARVDELRKQPTDPNHGTLIGGANG